MKSVKKNTWSVSKDQALHLCEKKYYFQYLVPAKINSKNTLFREIAFFKKFKNLSMCIEVSPTMVSKITDKVLPIIQEWHSRPLDRVYPIVFLDAMLLYFFCQKVGASFQVLLFSNSSA